MLNKFSRRVSAVVLSVAPIVFFTTVTVSAESRPFRMSAQGHANPVPTGPCTLSNSESGTGHALHLGALTWLSNEVVDRCAEGGPQVNAHFVLTAANGDQVFGRLRTVARFDDAAGQVTFAGLWDIDGGTGRFQDATGHGQVTGWGSLAAPYEVSAEFTGEINY